MNNIFPFYTWMIVAGLAHVFFFLGMRPTVENIPKVMLPTPVVMTVDVVAINAVIPDAKSEPVEKLFIATPTKSLAVLHQKESLAVELPIKSQPPIEWKAITSETMETNDFSLKKDMIKKRVNESDPSLSSVDQVEKNSQPRHDGRKQDQVTETLDLFSHWPVSKVEKSNVNISRMKLTDMMDVPIANQRVTRIETPVPLSDQNRPPHYPRQARRQGWQGTVFLNLDISARGQVEQITVDQSSGFRILDQAALKAVKSWRFRTDERHKNDQLVTLRLPIEFRLYSSATELQELAR